MLPDRISNPGPPINHSQDLDISIKTRLIIRMDLTYQDSNQSFTRLWHIKTPINSVFTRLGHSKTLINHLQHLGISKHMPIMSWICQSCQ